jgi:hypothetical protein
MLKQMLCGSLVLLLHLLVLVLHLLESPAAPAVKHEAYAMKRSVYEA